MQMFVKKQWKLNLHLMKTNTGVSILTLIFILGQNVLLYL